MTVKEFMVWRIRQIAADNSVGYTNNYPQNQWWRPPDLDCGSLQSEVLHDALLQIGIDTGYEYFEPMGKSGIYNEAFLLRYCDRYGYYEAYDEPADILVSSGHTEMVTQLDPKRLCGARDDYDGRQGDGSGREVAESAFFNNGWLYIYRLKDKYNKEIKTEEGYDMGKLPVCKKGDNNKIVMSFQYIMHYKLGYDKQPCDGRFDDRMEYNVKYYQGEHGLPVTGKLDAATQESMLVATGYEEP